MRYPYGRYSALGRIKGSDEWTSLSFWDGPDDDGIPDDAVTFEVGEPVHLAKVLLSHENIVIRDQVWWITGFVEIEKQPMVSVSRGKGGALREVALPVNELRKLDPLLRLAVEASD